MHLCMHTSAHEAMRSLRMAWAERMIETRQSAMTLVCCVRDGMGSAGPQAILVSGAHACVTYWVACVKSVKGCPSYV